MASSWWPIALPGPPSRPRKVSGLIEAAALRHGLVTYPCTGTVVGGPGDMMLLAPPLVITEQEMAEVLAILDLALGEVEETLEVR